MVKGADAVVFAAGGGPDSGAARKETVDKGAAVLLADAAEQAGVRRYVMVSSMGTDKADPDSDDVFQVYLRAKQAADDDLRARDLDWTVVRPGRLTDDAASGRVQVGTLARGRDPARRRGRRARGRADRRTRPSASTFDLLAGHQTDRGGARRALTGSTPEYALVIRQPVTMLTSFGARTITLRTGLAVQGALHVVVGQRQRLQVLGGDVRG